jgi:hypothetical protein
MNRVVAEFRRLALSGAIPLTVALAVVAGAIWQLRGAPVGPFYPNALILSRGWLHLAPMAYADVLDVAIPWTAVVALLIMEADCRHGQRVLPLSWPVSTALLGGARVLAVLVWGLAWTVAATAIPALLGLPVPFWRDVALVFPVVVCLTGLTYFATEMLTDPLTGATVAALVSLMGAGVRHLPFSHPVQYQLEVFDARNHLMGPGLMMNRRWLLVIGIVAYLAGIAALSLHRGRGTYQT